MSQSLLAIATFIALVGGVIFEKRSQEEETEQVDYAAKSLVTEKVESPILEEPTQTTLDLGEVASAPVLEEVPSEETEPDAEPVIADQLSLELTEEPDTEEPDFVEPRAMIAEIAIAPTIQDPKRGNSDDLDELSQTILTWGKTKELKQVCKLNQYATHRDPVIRTHAVAALQEIAARHPLTREVESMIPVLGKLTQDSSLAVRQLAVKALGEIRSEAVLPYLEQALLSPSSGVKKTAQSAIEKLKLGYCFTQSKQNLENLPQLHALSLQHKQINKTEIS
jgi:hypothetical protein